MGFKTDFQDDDSVRIFSFVFFWSLFAFNLACLFLSINKDPFSLEVFLFALFFITLPLIAVGTLLFGFGRYSVDEDSIKVLFYRKQYDEIKKENIYLIIYGPSYWDRNPKTFVRPTLYIIPFCVKDIEEIRSCDFSVLYKLKPDNEIFRFLEACKDVIKIKDVSEKKMRILLNHGYKVINYFKKRDNTNREIEL